MSLSQVTEELTVVDIQHFSFGFDCMCAVAPGISPVPCEFYILLYSADTHTSGFGPVVSPHKRLHFLKHKCVMARWKEVKQRC